MRHVKNHGGISHPSCPRARCLLLETLPDKRRTRRIPLGPASAHHGSLRNHHCRTWGEGVGKRRGIGGVGASVVAAWVGWSQFIWRGVGASYELCIAARCDEM